VIDQDIAKGVILPKEMSPTVFKINEVLTYQLAKNRTQTHRDLGIKKVFKMLHINIETIYLPSYGRSIYKMSCVLNFSRYKIIRTFAKKSQLGYVFFLVYSEVYEKNNNQLCFYLTSSKSSEKSSVLLKKKTVMLMAFFDSQYRASKNQQLQQLIEFKQGSMTIKQVEAFALSGRLKDAIRDTSRDVIPR
jgi:hypothetical protein